MKPWVNVAMSGSLYHGLLECLKRLLSGSVIVIVVIVGTISNGLFLF